MKRKNFLRHVGGIVHYTTEKVQVKRISTVLLYKISASEKEKRFFSKK